MPLKERKLISIARAHLEERSSMRIIARRKAISLKTVNNYVHLATLQVKDSQYIKEKFSPVWGGVLSVDGKYVKVYDPVDKRTFNYCWICGIDYPTKDLPYHLLHDEEGKIDLVIYFKRLKELGYPLKVLISDDNHEILEAARLVYGDSFKFQLCVRHYLEKLIRWIYPAKTDRLIEQIRRIILASDLKQAKQELKYLSDHRYELVKTKTQKQIYLDFNEHVKYLATYLKYPEYIPRTNNEIENLFRQLNLRLKTINRFYSWQYATNYLNAWALMRRFTPFTDCRYPNKLRNGKAPLELANCQIKRFDYLNL